MESPSGIYDRRAYPFIQARNYTRGRASPIDLVVLHTVEAPERADTAERVARWLAGPNAPRVSVHYVVDADSVVQCVRDGDVAWHAPGANHDGLGIEHAGYAAQTRQGWLDDYSRAMLDRSARLVAEKCALYGIPLAWLSPSDLRAGRRGITSHANVCRAFRRCDHTDPGRGFPVRRYLALVRRELGGAPFLRRGDSGESVKGLQRLLLEHGHDPGPVDGVFGPRTEAAVRSFQAEKGLEPDGVVGPLTWRALGARPSRKAN